MSSPINQLPDDMLFTIKSFLAPNAPSTLKIDEIAFIQRLNKWDTKQLNQYCKDNNIKKSSGGITNQYIKRKNIIESYMGRKISKDEDHVIVFTKGQSTTNHKNLSV